MKAALTTTMGLVLLLCSCSPQEERQSEQVYTEYTLNVEATGFKDSTIFYLYSSDLQDNLDTGTMIGGKMTLTGKVDFPQYAKLHTEFIPTDRGSYKKMRFWIENKPIQLSATFDDFKNGKVEGSPLNDMHNAISLKLEELDNTRDSLLAEYRHHPDPSSLIAEELDRYNVQRREIIFNFIKEHPNNEVCIRKLSLYKDDIQLSELIDIFGKVDTTYYSYLHSREIINHIKNSLDELGGFAEGE